MKTLNKTRESDITYLLSLFTASTLHEWHQLVRQLYVQQHVGDKETQIKEIQGVMRVVMDMRDNLISNRMTHADAKETQQKVTSFMDLINNRTGLDLVVRDEEGNILSPLRYCLKTICIQTIYFQISLNKLMDSHSNLTLIGTPLSKCIVNIRKVQRTSMINQLS